MSVFNWYDGVYEFNTKVPNYVEGNWQPIHNEMHKVSSVGVGELPKNLIGGMYVRSGANPKCWPPGNRMRNHAFNGESMLHLLVSYLLNHNKPTWFFIWIWVNLVLRTMKLVFFQDWVCKSQWGSVFEFLDSWGSHGHENMETNDRMSIFNRLWRHSHRGLLLFASNAVVKTEA